MVKKAMIMAAGVGSRLDPLTKSTPKPLIPIVNQPVMDLLLKQLSLCGIKQIVANTHCLAEKIHQKYKENNPTSIQCNFVYEETLSGTAGGVKKCEKFFDGEDSFIVMSGDGLTDANLEEIIKSHIKSGAIATMGLTRVPKQEVKHFGVVVTDKNNKVVEFQEKPAVEEAKSNLVNTGIYIFKTEIFKYIPANTFFDFAKNVFPALMNDNKLINTFEIKGYWSDIGTLNQYRTSTVDVMNAQGIKLAKGKNTIIENGVILEGHNVIGDNCVIKSGAHLKNSILWNNITIKENAKLDNCILADNILVEKNIVLEKSSVIAANSTITSNISENDNKGVLI